MLMLRDKSHIKPINLTIMESLSTVKLSCNYLYHHEWNEKFITLQQLAGWIQQGRYARRINAVRGLETVRFVCFLNSLFYICDEIYKPYLNY